MSKLRQFLDFQFDIGNKKINFLTSLEGNFSKTAWIYDSSIVIAVFTKGKVSGTESYHNLL